MTQKTIGARFSSASRNYCNYLAARPPQLVISTAHNISLNHLNQFKGRRSALNSDAIGRGFPWGRSCGVLGTVSVELSGGRNWIGIFGEILENVVSICLLRRHCFLGIRKFLTTNRIAILPITHNPVWRAPRRLPPTKSESPPFYFYCYCLLTPSIASVTARTVFLWLILAFSACVSQEEASGRKEMSDRTERRMP